MPVGIDIGGTFTDFVLLKDGVVTVHKVPSTPGDPADGFMRGLRDLGIENMGLPLVHGSTVATNAILEGKGARTALITTSGFRDVLAIGRQNRPKLYDLEPRRLPPLVPDDLRFEVKERVDFQGHVVTPLDLNEVDALLERLSALGVESLAVSLLFSFLHPEHELAIKERAIARGFTVSASSQVLPEYREYERTSTTVINAYVSPVVGRYLDRLTQDLPQGEGHRPSTGSPRERSAERTPFSESPISRTGHRLRIMQSNGGSITAEAAASVAARTALSGPAAGVVGAFYVANLAGFRDIISFDMGGTSTDVSLCPGRPQETTEGSVGGYPIRLPMVDIHTIGAGGGSIARLDEAGALRVGPQSAGADPGPACYGKGDQLTVTDAHLVLGRLKPGQILGGSIPLDVDRVWPLMAKLGDSMGMGMERAAQGIIKVANANMERAIRVISVERGHDPRRFTLVAFGGAGPLHACDIAEALRIPRVLVPLYPGVLSALGMLAADVIKDYSHTVMWSLPPQPAYDSLARQIAMGFRPLLAQGWGDMRAEGLPNESVRVLLSLDMRYRGQSYELTVPMEGRTPEEMIEAFHQLHQERFGYSQPGEPVEIVNLRLKMVGVTEKPALAKEPLQGPDPSAAIVEERTVWFDGPERAKVYDRARLRPGNIVAGPAVVAQMDCTTALPTGWVGQVDGYGNLILERV